MKTTTNFSKYGNDLKLTKSDANFCNQLGDCLPMVLKVMKKPYIKKQLAKIAYVNLHLELGEIITSTDYYGYIDWKNLYNHEHNLQLWVWISSINISENKNI